MKKLNLILIVCAIFISVNVIAQDITPPPPVNSEILNSMEGSWNSEPYDAMGSKMTDEVTQRVILNGQFMEVDVKSTSDKGFVYEGKGMFAQNADGTFSGWFFDIFGVTGISTYTGTSEANKLYLTGTSKFGSEIRNISVDGNIMMHMVISEWKDKDGKALPKQTYTITFNKK